MQLFLLLGDFVFRVLDVSIRVSLTLCRGFFVRGFVVSQGFQLCLDRGLELILLLEPLHIACHSCGAAVYISLAGLR